MSYRSGRNASTDQTPKIQASMHPSLLILVYVPQFTSPSGSFLLSITSTASPKRASLGRSAEMICGVGGEGPLLLILRRFSVSTNIRKNLVHPNLEREVIGQLVRQ